jgi:hypothetical protein
MFNCSWKRPRVSLQAPDICASNLGIRVLRQLVEDSCQCQLLTDHPAAHRQLGGQELLKLVDGKIHWKPF